MKKDQIGYSIHWKQNTGEFKYQKSTVRFYVCHYTVLLIENEVDNSNCSGYTLVPPVLFVQEMTGPLDFSNSVITVISWQTSDISPIVLKYKNNIVRKKNPKYK